VTTENPMRRTDYSLQISALNITKSPIVKRREEVITTSSQYKTLQFFGDKAKLSDRL